MSSQTLKAFGVVVALCFGSSVHAKTIVFWQHGFPTVSSEPVSQAALTRALGADVTFVGIDALRDASALAQADLLVMPYGSAFPAEDWPVILTYLGHGGRLVALGGQPFRVPVTRNNDGFHQEPPQDTYSLELGIRHTYEVPVPPHAAFRWKPGYAFLGSAAVTGRHFYTLEGQVNGLGYMLEADGTRSAAPVVVVQRAGNSQTHGGAAPQIVMLDFDPAPGYWESGDGVALIHQASEYARQGVIHFSVEVMNATVRPDESVQISLHVQRPMAQPGGLVTTEIAGPGGMVDRQKIACEGNSADVDLPFHKILPPGFYTVRATYEYGGKPREFFRNGFWVESPEAVTTGPTLAVQGDFLTRDGAPFLPFGTNYFTTEESGWDFSGPRNAAAWQDDFADMARHGVTFVRTGVWMNNGKFVEPLTGQVNERFLRNLEAYLLCAQLNHIAVNFTFYSFTPKTGYLFPVRQDQPEASLPNPYTNAASLRDEKRYVLSIVNRFRNVPWLSWDLINEPSFSNPKKIFSGNVPNGDATEVAAWQSWLREKYGDLDHLAAAWGVTPQQLGSFEGASLPDTADLHLARYGNRQEVRAIDYNLFAQEAFGKWIHTMVTAIREAGSRQLIDVGQDEGGVQNRLLNQFLVKAGVSFTVNHTYHADDALLWDSLVARQPGTPNFVGETGYQPVWWPDGSWRYDELSGFALEEKKWAFGFAAGNSGAVQWDWARETDFGMQRSDGSAKVWQAMMRAMGAFAKAAAPSATALVEPQVAIILPQSLQLSVMNATAIAAQQAAVRALYHYAHGEAYAVGEYQMAQLGSPRLIILPSPYVLTEEAWQAILARVNAGAILLVSGPFDEDAHFHATNRQAGVGLPYTDEPLLLHENHMSWPGGNLSLVYSGEKISQLNRAVLANGKSWDEVRVGRGRILFSPLPLELNDNLAAIGEVYRYALHAAGVEPVYAADQAEPGLLIAPTQLAHSTLYVLSSETDKSSIGFTDRRSGKHITGTLPPGRTALLLLGEDGRQLAAYNWNGPEK